MRYVVAADGSESSLKAARLLLEQSRPGPSCSVLGSHRQVAGASRPVFDPEAVGS